MLKAPKPVVNKRPGYGSAFTPLPLRRMERYAGSSTRIFCNWPDGGGVGRFDARAGRR